MGKMGETEMGRVATGRGRWRRAGKGQEWGGEARGRQGWWMRRSGVGRGRQEGGNGVGEMEWGQLEGGDGEGAT